MSENPDRDAGREPLSPPTLDQVRAARERIRGVAIRTPLLRLPLEPGEIPGAWSDGSSSGGPPGGPPRIWLKLENLQPIGSFKLRGATNAIRTADPEALVGGVYTASAGNMAQGVAWSARELGLPATVVVPDHAPRTKLEAIERLGGRVEKVPFDRWWQVVLDHSYPGQEGLFIHPVSDPGVMAGNGTVALEILEDLPGVDVVLVPYGGGGLSCGIAAVLGEARPEARVYGCEVGTAAPLAASLAAGEPRTVDYRPSFVDGIGSKGLLPEMWPLARHLLAGSRVVSLEEVASAIRLLASRQRVIAEGAGAAPVAAALAGAGELAEDCHNRNETTVGEPLDVVCVVSGGNLDFDTLGAILRGELP